MRKRNELLDLAFENRGPALTDRARLAHEIHQELRELFRGPPLSDELLVSNGLKLARVNADLVQRAEARCIYKIGGVIPSINRPDQLRHAVVQLMNMTVETLKKQIDDPNRTEFVHLIDDWWNEIAPIRAKFVRALGALVVRSEQAFIEKYGAAPKERALKEIRKREDELLRDLFVLPVTVSDSRYVWLNEAALCNLTLTKIAGDTSPKNSLLDRLWVCAREDCRAFFLRAVQTGGGPKEKYCNPECTKIVNQRENAERQRRRRMRMKK